MTVLSEHDSLLLDLDGTVWEGGRPLQCVVDVINSGGVPAVYVTNNASRGPAAVAQMLKDIGLSAQAEDVVTSAQAAVAQMRGEIPAGATVLVIGAESLRGLVRAAGFVAVDSAAGSPAAVVQGFSPDISWEKLSEAAYAIRAGAKYFATNLDASLPTERGLAVGNGSLVRAVANATGVEPVSAGKPEPAMFLQAARRVGSKRPLVVGDRLDTDIAGGNAAAMNTFHVLTGVSGEFELIEAPVEHRPSFIGAGFHELASPAAEVRPGAQGQFTARVDGVDVLLEGGQESSTSAQALRTVLEVVWSMPAPPRYVQPRGDAATRAVSSWR